MYKSVFSVFFLLIISFKSFSQSDSIIINQDPKLKKVIELKKIVNQEAFTSGQYTIQVFSGNFTDYKNLMDKLKTEGKYVSRIKAIKELKNIKKEFSSAFILQPK